MTMVKKWKIKMPGKESRKKGFFSVAGPPGTPYKQNEEKLKVRIWSVGYQNRVKREFIYKGMFGKY